MTIVFPKEEVKALRDLWRGRERVDWAAYDRAKARILATVEEQEQEKQQ
jgi:hypothetical protein